MKTINGKIDIESLEYPENFPEGTYILQIEDATDCFLAEKLEAKQFELVIKGSANQHDPKKQQGKKK